MPGVFVAPVPLSDGSQPDFLPSPVHPPESNSDSLHVTGGGVPQPNITLAATFRHSGWQRIRDLIFDSLHRTGQTSTRRRAFAECGMFAYVYQSLDDPHRFRLGGSSCHDRYCVPCSRDRAYVLAENVLKVLDGQPARFATLTLRHSDDTLRAQLDRLYKCFAHLRARKAWKSRVDGGAAFLECKWIEKTKTWHPHLHVIIHGRYFDKNLLKAEWYRVTGDSYITDIRLIDQDAKVAAYVTKYVAKPFDGSFINRPALLDEHISAMHRRRLCLTFGNWRGVQLTQTPDPGAWLSLGSLENLADQANAGDGVALEALSQICGLDLAEVLNAAKLARPPPPKRTPNTVPSCVQFTFGWPEGRLSF